MSEELSSYHPEDISLEIPSTNSVEYNFELPSIEELQQPNTIEDLLANAPIMNIDWLGGGANQSYLITLEGGRGVFKPESGRHVLTASSGIPFYRRSTATYQLAKLLGFCHQGIVNVPVTVIRSIPIKSRQLNREVNRIGSIQEYIDDAEVSVDSNARTLPGDQVNALALFDYIVWQSDRHKENILKEAKLYASDNDTTFVEEDRYSLVGDQIYRQSNGIAIPEAFRRCMLSYTESDKIQQVVSERLGGLLISNSNPNDGTVFLAALHRLNLVAKHVESNDYVSQSDLSKFVFDPADTLSKKNRPYFTSR